MPQLARKVTTPNEIPRGVRVRLRLTSDEWKVLQILAMMIATPWLCLAMVTLGPSALHLVLDVLQ